MSRLTALTVPKLASVQISVLDATRIELKGTVTAKDPAQDLGVFLRAAHDAAIADRVRALKVDVSGLTFVNSSAIRLFIDWANWLRSDPTHRYKLHLLTSRRVTWQKTSFLALTSLARDLLEIEHVD